MRDVLDLNPRSAQRWAVPAKEPDDDQGPSRILRELRLRGWVNYEVTNRRQSAYRVTSVR
jgi:hypothetical protein